MVGAVVWEPAWPGEGETPSDGKTTCWSAIHREAECLEGWEWWAVRDPVPPGTGGLAEAAEAGGSGRGSDFLCWCGVWG